MRYVVNTKRQFPESPDIRDIRLYFIKVSLNFKNPDHHLK